ncbi:MAG TPA: substrate-binding domain-containing protein [Nitrospirota bacterium]
MFKRISFFVIAALLLASPSFAETRVVLASTTSTQATGLFDMLIPAYYKWTKFKDVKIDVVAVGTGKAMEIAKRGDADLLLVHDREKEDAFVAEGFGLGRKEVMYNDFVIVGPKEDPAGVTKSVSAADAFKKMSVSSAGFISRGDESGTHAREKKMWKAAGVDVKDMKGYLSIGQGMEQALRLADEKGAYTIADRGTYLALKDTLKGDTLLYAGDKALFNQYAAIAVSPAKFPKVHIKEAEDFISFITGPDGQAAIGSFKDKYGNLLFKPNAKK